MEEQQIPYQCEGMELGRELGIGHAGQAESGIGNKVINLTVNSPSYQGHC